MNEPWVADDHAAFRLALCQFLRHEGYECVGVADASEAGAQLRQGGFDLLISDINMPGNGRLEFIHELAATAADLPVILLTGHPTMQSAADSVRLPVVAYLTKPPPLGEFTRVIADAVNRGRLDRAARAEWQSMQQLAADLARVRRELAEPSDGSPAVLVPPQIARALDDLLGALTVARPAGADGTAAARPAELVRAVRETVVVLEQTKRAFKSRQLGALREKLQALLGPDASPG